MARVVGESQRVLERSRECYIRPWCMEKTSENLRGPERDQGRVERAREGSESR